MFVITKKYKFQKGYSVSIKKIIDEVPMMQHAEGFIRRDILIQDKFDFDYVLIMLYWKDHVAHEMFKKSPTHQLMHKNHGSHNIEGLVEMQKETYDLVKSDPYVKEN